MHPHAWKHHCAENRNHGESLLLTLHVPSLRLRIFPTSELQPFWRPPPISSYSAFLSLLHVCRLCGKSRDCVCIATPGLAQCLASSWQSWNCINHHPDNTYHFQGTYMIPEAFPDQTIQPKAAPVTASTPYFIPLIGCLLHNIFSFNYVSPTRTKAPREQSSCLSPAWTEGHSKYVLNFIFRFQNNCIML